GAPLPAAGARAGRAANTPCQCRLAALRSCCLPIIELVNRRGRTFPQFLDRASSPANKLYIKDWRTNARRIATQLPRRKASPNAPLQMLARRYRRYLVVEIPARRPE